ncbi:hypothetical protein DFH09DRAFT_1325707 [Mycena vulgaris]|nr:hypothetical protein DFH09DRAFT_1325707 [Mycena vulgaris]
MPSAPLILGTTDTSRIEAPVTLKTYFMCLFAAFGSIFFGYHTGWMGGPILPNAAKLPADFSLRAWEKSHDLRDVDVSDKARSLLSQAIDELILYSVNHIVISTQDQYFPLPKAVTWLNSSYFTPMQLSPTASPTHISINNPDIPHHRPIFSTSYLSAS